MRKFSEFIRLSRFGLRHTPADARDSERHKILSQDSLPQKPTAHLGRRGFLGRHLPVTAPLGFLGIVAVVMWVSWPRAGVINLDALAKESPQRIAAIERPRADAESLAVLNPLNIPAVQITRGPEFIPVNDESSEDETLEAEPTSALDNITVVTPTPEAIDAAILSSDRAISASGTQTSTSGTQSGIVLAGQQLPVAGLTPEATVDPVLLSELLAPLLEDQTNPTPLVIELEIPSGVTDGSTTGLDAIDLLAPSSRSGTFPRIMLLPTATPTSEPHREVAASAGIPLVQIVPAVGIRYTPTPTPAPTATPAPEPTALWSVSGPVAGRLWSSFEPRPAEQGDHFWVGNAFTDVAANSFASPNYQFGSTAGGRYRPHHGVDISNPTGTPIRAGVSGEVVFAGPDDIELFGPYNNFYGNVVVIRLDRRLPVAGGRLDVYVLYGHLNDVRVTTGQRVEPSDIVGRVGMTGIAIGPHLHVEIRLGANTYAHNVNPYLWMEPRPGNGAVAVRLLTNDGRTWAGAKVSIARFEGGKAVWARQIETYLDVENIGPDPAWGENGAMGDVPAGYYYLIGKVGGESIRAEFPVVAGQTSFIEVRTQQ